MPVPFTSGHEPARAPIHRRLLIAGLIQAVVCGCSRPRQTEDANVQLTVAIRPQPPVTGTAYVEVLLRDATGNPLEATAVRLEGNMSHPGMRPSLAMARRMQPGRWLGGLELTMGGDWLLLVQAELADGRKIERTMELRGVVPQ